MKEDFTEMQAEVTRQPSDGKRNVKMFVGILITLLATLTILISPTAWAGPDQGAAPRATSVSGTWAGQIDPHDIHFDYVGSPCPLETELCTKNIVRYRIVPITGQAREALPPMSGRQAQLQGVLAQTSVDTHQGTLFVQRVEAGN